MSTSLTSNKPASKDQARRVRTLTMEAIEGVLESNEDFIHDELQVIHSNAAPYKRELAASFKAFVKSFAKKLLGIITPVTAEESGLIPNGWTVYAKDGVRQDFLEGDISLANLDYSICPLQDGDGDYVNGDTMLERATKAHAYGSLGLAAALLKAQEEGKEIFPVESRGKHYFIMPRTILLSGVRDRGVAYFYWSGGSRRWVLNFHWVDGHFNRDGRFVCPREEKPLAA